MLLDGVERLYIAGFAFLQLFVTLLPILTRPRTSASAAQNAAVCAAGDHCVLGDSVSVESSALEFLPLMLTSVYCAVGLVWAFVRLSVIYLGQF